MNKLLVSGQIGLIALALLGAAQAQELPREVLLGIPLSAGIVQSSSSHTYGWIDAGYQSASIPVVNPGQSTPLSIVSPSWSAMRPTDPFPNGFGIRGAIGIILPSGTFSNALGADQRLELLTSYSNIGGLMSDERLAANGPQLFNGGNSLLGCAAIVNCLPAAMSPTTYQTLQFDLRAASDFRLGRALVTPSLTLFSKDARSQQSFYQASSSSAWTEWGAKLGLDTTLELNERHSFGLRSSVGSAYRSAAFASSETGAAFTDGSTIGSMPTVTSGRWTGTPVTATAEASYMLRPTPGTTIRAFAGMMYDSRSPVSSESLGLDPTTVGAISYESMINYYYGIGVKIRFDANGT
jgi:hypothetical protein